MGLGHEIVSPSSSRRDFSWQMQGLHCAKKGHVTRTLHTVAETETSARDFHICRCERSLVDFSSVYFRYCRLMITASVSLRNSITSIYK
jgi:hypothetical protein